MDFLSKLVTRADEFHLEWEYRNPSSQVPKDSEKFILKRPERGMTQSEAMEKRAEEKGKMPVPSRGGTSLRQNHLIFSANADKFMLFGKPKGHRDNQIKSIYRSLLVYDLVAYGSTVESLYTALNGCKMSDLISSRNLIPEYEFLGSGFYRPFAETRILRDHFEGQTLFQKNGRKQSKFVIDKLRVRYLERANILIDLAAKGRFKEYPRFLTPTPPVI
jgi:hypothetical protein